MREIGLLLFAMVVVPNVSHAAGLKDLVAGADSAALRMLYSVLAIFAIGLIGAAGSIVMNAFGNSRFGKMFVNGCYLAAAGVFMSIGVTLLKQFMDLIYG